MGQGPVKTNFIELLESMLDYLEATKPRTESETYIRYINLYDDVWKALKELEEL